MQDKGSMGALWSLPAGLGTALAVLALSALASRHLIEALQDLLATPRSGTYRK